jgi:hypothetical protein
MPGQELPRHAKIHRNPQQMQRRVVTPPPDIHDVVREEMLEELALHNNIPSAGRPSHGMILADK